MDIKVMDTGFILDFRGRNSSAEYDQNFLWRSGSIYIMDNHRAALWCWLQHIKTTSKYNLLHIDAHYDCLNSRLNEWLQALPADIGKYTLDKYLGLSYTAADSMSNIPIIRFDNYLSIFLRRYSSNINECVFATHGNGVKPEWANTRELSCSKLIGGTTWSLEQSQWIVNIDVDYFFYPDYDMNFHRLNSLTHLSFQLPSSLRKKILDNPMGDFSCFV